MEERPLDLEVEMRWACHQIRVEGEVMWRGHKVAAAGTNIVSEGAYTATEWIGRELGEKKIIKGWTAMQGTQGTKEQTRMAQGK